MVDEDTNRSISLHVVIISSITTEWAELSHSIAGVADLYHLENASYERPLYLKPYECFPSIVCVSCLLIFSCATR